MRACPLRLPALLLAVALVAAGRVEARQRELVVSAAASLTDVMTTLAGLYRAERQVILRVNTGGSNTLARQIIEGAGVDVFISADEAQMDGVEKAGRVVAGTRRDVVANALVVVVPTSVAGPTLHAAGDLAAPTIRRVAMGNPGSVPAGVYGRQWLEALGLWADVQPKVISLPTVRAALAAVQEARVDAGLVYATDARVTDAVTVVLEVPVEDGPRIRYPAAAIRGEREAAATAFVDWLGGTAARAVFERAGFRPVPPTP